MPSLQKVLRARQLPFLTRPVEPEGYVEVTGERVALLGREDGTFECWIWPLKVLSELSFGLLREGRALELDQREVTVLPDELMFQWRAGDVQLRTEVFACRERPGLALGFALDSEEPLELEVGFRCDFRPLWPAALGGALGRVDRVTGAFALTEEVGRFAALIGAERATVEHERGDHGLPDGRVRVRIPMAAGGASTVLAIAAAEVEPPALPPEALRGEAKCSVMQARAEHAIGAARELWWRLVSDFSGEREAVRAHWARYMNRTVALETPDKKLDRAFTWSKIALERSWGRVEGLGRGLLGGLGPSGSGDRPGLAAFRDADALAAARAQVGVGDHAGAREVLRAAAARQRVDGKIMHELPLSARLCRWFEDFPYAWRGVQGTPDFVTLLEHHVRLSGDLDVGRELWPNALRAIDWCSRSLDAAGRLVGRGAGVAGLGANPIAERIESEASLQGAWFAALGAAQRLAQFLGEDAAQLRPHEDRVRAAFEDFWSEERGRYGFALLEGGALCDDLSAHLGLPLMRGLGERARAWASVQALNRPAAMSDRGARAFASDGVADLVFPPLTASVTQALFAHGHAQAALQVLASQVELCGRAGLGFLEDHVEGEGQPLGMRSIPHRITSSGALVESILFGLFGVEASAHERRVAFRPSLPPDWEEACLNGLCIGDARLDVRFYRRRAKDGTRIGVEVEQSEGAPLAVGYAPVLPPLSRLFDGPGWLRPSGAIVPRRFNRSPGPPFSLEARVLEGPSLLLPGTLPARGEASRSVRLVGQEPSEGGLVWRFAAPAGTETELAFWCDFPVRVSGAQLGSGKLALAFPAGEPGTWAELAVEVHPR